MTKKRKKAIRLTVVSVLTAVVVFFVVELLRPTYTPGIKGENSISELKQVSVNDTRLEVMIRGADRTNPVVLFVHGGPCCPEIPYVRKYQTDLEKEFTIVHYDQRGCGKSYVFGEDYSADTVQTHVEDVVALTEYLQTELQTDRVILIGHSFGTYIATCAAAARPDLFLAYVGIGQMSDTVESERITLDKLICAAEEAGNKRDADRLREWMPAVGSGEMLIPRDMIRKYGMAARGINDTADYPIGILFGTEYNLTDGIRLAISSKYQKGLLAESIRNPLTGTVTELDLPIFFVMGRYDGMTAPETAERYLYALGGEGTREWVLFDDSAHYPQFEERDAFLSWMVQTFKNEAGEPSDFEISS